MKVVHKIAEVRSEYTSARLICANLEHRVAGTRYERFAGYLPPQIDYTTVGGRSQTMAVRDYDVRFLDRVSSEKAIAHLGLIHLARHGAGAAREELERRTRALYPTIAARFAGPDLIENEHVIPYTTAQYFSEDHVSQKGAILLDLSRRGLATSDFNLLAASAYQLPEAERQKCALDAIRNLEILSGRKLGDPDNPLLIAMRSAIPEYIPGFMPTYLNVGLTPELLPGLPDRYGQEAAARIRLNNRKTILEALDPESFKALEKELRSDLSKEENHKLASRIEAVIRAREPRLLADPRFQILFFLRKAYDYYETHLDALRNFMRKTIHYPTIIFQRMVCSVIDENSYAGVLYSRHPRTGIGVYLQYVRTVFGEEMMTGRMRPEEIGFMGPEEARHSFSAVYHFWRRLAQLEDIFGAPVMVEFTGVHGTFTLLQVNPAEIAGVGMLTAAMDMHRAGKIGSDRVRQLIKPYHVRQIESDAIDPKSLQSLTPFCRGISVLPRSAVSGRIYFSGLRIARAREDRSGENVILAKERFTPTDAIEMQKVNGICSLSPAAIHVVTTAQNLGIPALLNLEEDGVHIHEAGRSMINADGMTIQEGDWVTISSRNKKLYIGKAVFASARLLRFMAGEPVKFTAAERPFFERWAIYYREYRSILENVEASEFKSLQDLGHAVLYGKLQQDPQKAAAFINQCFDANREELVRRLLDTTLGTHRINMAAFEKLSPDRQVQLLKAALARCRDRGLSGYQAGAFVIGSLMKADSPVVFWESFEPSEIALLINEWVLHQKYLHILDDVGERKISRAKDVILSYGLGQLHIHHGLIFEFMPLKLSRVDLEEVRRCLPESCDPQTTIVLDLLLKPFSEFYDFSQPWSLARLQKICETQRIPFPDPEDI